MCSYTGLIALTLSTHTLNNHKLFQHKYKVHSVCISIITAYNSQPSFTCTDVTQVMITMMIAMV